MIVFGNFDISGFWSGGDYERETYVGAAMNDELVSSVERELGYKLPASYLELMRVQNGGTPRKTCHGTNSPTSWAEDHIAITGIFAIDRKPSCSLCGQFKSQFWVEEWGYPPIGIYFADCPSAGHDMLCLDYRNAQSGSEPSVVHVDQGNDYQITTVAANFESFIRNLQSEESFPLF